MDKLPQFLQNASRPTVNLTAISQAKATVFISSYENSDIIMPNTKPRKTEWLPDLAD